MLETRRAHTFGIITSGEVLEAFKASQPIDIPSIQQSPLHSILTAHNKANPTRPAAFVAVVGREDKAVEVDDVQYFGIDTQSNAVGAIRIDVDVESARSLSEYIGAGRFISSDLRRLFFRHLSLFYFPAILAGF